MKPIPTYGNHISLEEFITHCKKGYFIDYDGCGFYATKTEMTDKIIIPSDVIGNASKFNFKTGKFKKIKKKVNIDKSYKYIVWFNK